MTTVHAPARRLKRRLKVRLLPLPPVRKVVLLRHPRRSQIAYLLRLLLSQFLALELHRTSRRQIPHRLQVKHRPGRPGHPFLDPARRLLGL